MLSVFGYDDAPHGHAELEFRDVRVPCTNLLHEEGQGFAMAQARLGPGRIHHCMRAIGLAERALALLCRRAKTRRVFGQVSKCPQSPDQGPLGIPAQRGTSLHCRWPPARRLVTNLCAVPPRVRLLHARSCWRRRVRSSRRSPTAGWSWSSAACWYSRRRT